MLRPILASMVLFITVNLYADEWKKNLPPRLAEAIQLSKKESLKDKTEIPILMFSENYWCPACKIARKSLQEESVIKYDSVNSKPFYIRAIKEDLSNVERGPILVQVGTKKLILVSVRDDDGNGKAMADELNLRGWPRFTIWSADLKKMLTRVGYKGKEDFINWVDNFDWWNTGSIESKETWVNKKLTELDSNSSKNIVLARIKLLKEYYSDKSNREKKLHYSEIIYKLEDSYANWLVLWRARSGFELSPLYTKEMIEKDIARFKEAIINQEVEKAEFIYGLYTVISVYKSFFACDLEQLNEKLKPFWELFEKLDISELHPRLQSTYYNLMLRKDLFNGVDKQTAFLTRLSREPEDWETKSANLRTMLSWAIDLEVNIEQALHWNQLVLQICGDKPGCELSVYTRYMELYALLDKHELVDTYFNKAHALVINKMNRDSSAYEKLTGAISSKGVLPNWKYQLLGRDYLSFSRKLVSDKALEKSEKDYEISYNYIILAFLERKFDNHSMACDYANKAVEIEENSYLKLYRDTACKKEKINLCE